MRIYLIGLAIIACFAAGWLSNGWRINSKEQKSTAKTLVDLQDRMEKQVDKMEKFNSKTAEEEIKVLASMRKTQAELRGIRDEISNSNVGACRITPDGDRLRAETYRSAIATPDAP